MPQRITVAHSPDADDAFMFYALATGKVGDPDLEFVHVLKDIQTLNERAFRGEYEVTAVSFHAYAYLADAYVLLPHGASFGDGYGPCVIAAESAGAELKPFTYELADPSGTQVLIPLLVLIGVAQMAGDRPAAMELLVLAGAVCGFLSFNLRSPWRNRALVFMGDTGGLLLGLFLAWYSIRLAGADASRIRPITSVWILAVPLLDMGAVMFLRMLQKKSPFAADRQHLHYILIDIGFSVGQVVGMMGVASVATSALALLAEAHGVPEYVMFAAFVGLLLGYLAILANPGILARLPGARAGSPVKVSDSPG